MAIRPTSAAHAARLRELAADLTQLCLDLTGIFDPTPVSDGANALISLARGNWLDAALSGVSIIPYVGDLAKAGKFPRYLKSLENAIKLASESAEAAQLLRPVMQKLDQALDLLPTNAGPQIARMRELVAEFLQRNGVGRALRNLPDISKTFRFSVFTQGEYTIKQAAGRLGVPGKVKTHRSGSAQRGVSAGTGDDAGHLIGNRFGAPGGAENLAPQNWQANQYGTFKQLENEWERKLLNGHGIEVAVQDIFHPKYGMDRPFMRRVEWVEIAPSGALEHRSLVFANPHTVKSRDARGIGPSVNGPQLGNVIHVDFQNRRVIPR